MHLYLINYITEIGYQSLTFRAFALRQRDTTLPTQHTTFISPFIEITKCERWLTNITPLYAILNSMENLRFDKTKGYFYVLVFYGLFYKRNRKRFFPCSHIHTCFHSWKFGRTVNGVETLTSIFLLQFLVLPNFRSSFYNCMETRKIHAILSSPKLSRVFL